jgi:hypothetical protein
LCHGQAFGHALRLLATGRCRNSGAED